MRATRPAEPRCGHVMVHSAVLMELDRGRKHHFRDTTRNWVTISEYRSGRSQLPLAGILVQAHTSLSCNRPERGPAPPPLFPPQVPCG